MTAADRSADLAAEAAAARRDLRTLRDVFRWAASRFGAADLVFGHGATNGLDEAAYIVLEGLNLPVDRLEIFLDARLTPAERDRLVGLVVARIETRKPAAYLLGRTYIQGVPFRVDARTIVPRSFIGELLMTGLVGEGGLIDDPGAIGRVLDLCTGGGSLAILAARVFPNARVDAVDVSADALAVARQNVEEHGLEDRVRLIEGDLFAPLGRARYDLIIANPPYVTAAAVAAFPPEYAAEPVLAHLGGQDGLDIVRRILAGAIGYVEKDGALICEVGTGRAALEQAFPQTPFLWLDTQESEGEVFLLPAEALPTAPPRRPAPERPKRPRAGRA
ncbi:MAG: 50S ribosomal protein L3 N(5)-glutamine methyltransferase [Methylobacteriaceae bacterium]|nr:50S ribosomal protein L3 N(5)-glutamine methyltransferase [Methylobacteriaceae bacterium]